MNEKPFVIALSQSIWLLIYLIIVHAVMLAIIISLLTSSVLLLIVIVFVSASFIFYCQRYQWIKSDRSIIKIVRDDKGYWQLYYFDGSAKQKLALKHCVVTAQLIILNFSDSLFWRTTSITIMADAVDAELFRQLRVYLRDPKTFQQ